MRQPARSMGRASMTASENRRREESARDYDSRAEQAERRGDQETARRMRQYADRCRNG